jgi:hypothetical protein
MSARLFFLSETRITAGGCQVPRPTGSIDGGLFGAGSQFDSLPPATRAALRSFAIHQHS